MNRKKYCIILLAIFSACVVHAQHLQLAQLRCQHLINPVGIDLQKPVLSWELQSNQNNVLQTAYRVLVATDSLLLLKNNGDSWDSKKINRSNSIQVAYEGKPLIATKKYYWKVQVWDNKGNTVWSRINSWQMALPDASDWIRAQWIGYEKMPDSGYIVPFAHGKGKKEWGSRKDILPLLRKEFPVQKKIRSASLFICGLGQFEVSINGSKVGDHFLDPGWTQYSKNALYVSFDVTPYLKQGNNAIGVMLGNGFYYIPGERYRKLTGAFGFPKMKARLVINYTDDTEKNIVSGDDWKAAPSPITFSSIYGGEEYDARLEQSNWNKPGFNDGGWRKAVVVNGPQQLHAQLADAVKLMQAFNPVTDKKLADGSMIYDLAQNFSGIPSVTVSGSWGDTVVLVPAELINDDGTPNQKATGSPYYCSYILKGDGKETWQPRFTYYGFRYVQVKLLPAKPGGAAPKLWNITGLHTRNSMEVSGSFACSNTLFNQTFNLIDWAIKSNTVSVFTDCPHREKLGWLEETQLMGSSVQYNYNIANLCRKVVHDMMDAQTAEGLIPEIAPEYVQFDEPFRDSPEWGSAAIIFPWYAYQWYGDKAILEEAYPMMKKYLDYLQTKAVGNILSQGLGDWFDIGPNRPGVSQLTPKGVTATATWFYDLSIMKDIAILLGKESDAQQFEKLAGEVKISFNKKYFNGQTGSYATNSQAANAMALYMNLVAPEKKEAVLGALVADIRERKNAFTAGDIGYRYVLRALEDAGRSDVIFDMNSRTDVPGYGYQLAHGATALTESWQAYPSVSNNHFMLGHLMEWFYSGLSGIQNAKGAVAFKTIVIKPQPAGDVTEVKTSCHTPYGWIKLHWQKKGKSFLLDLTIPANATAEITLPANETMNEPVKIGSGTYHYEVILK